MVHDLPVRTDHDPLFPVLLYHGLDHLVCLVTQTRVDNADTCGNGLLLATASRFPAIKYNGDVMTFQFSVCNKLLNKLFPLFLQIPVLYADEIIPVYDYRRNSSASGDIGGDIIALPCLVGTS